MLAHQIELVEKRRLRVEPPPPPPNWLSKCKEGSWNPVRQGAKLELFLEEGWWYACSTPASLKERMHAERLLLAVSLLPFTHTSLPPPPCEHRPVELIKKKVGGKDSHKVWSPMYDKYHTVPSKRLRPDPLG